MAYKRKLSDDDALALVLGGFKGEVPPSSLCRRYGVTIVTYYKLRDRFLEAGIAGLRTGKLPEVKALEDRVRELERALGRKTLEVEIFKKQKK